MRPEQSQSRRDAEPSKIRIVTTRWTRSGLFVLSFFALGPVARAQQEMPGMQMPAPGQEQHEQASHQQMSMPAMEAKFPRLGRAQEAAQGKLFTLEEAQKLAKASNPTLRQAEAEIRIAKARQLQSGLYPNPRAGYTGDEIRGGSTGGGKQGFFVEQTIVTAGKLGLNRKVLGQDAKLAETEAQEQRMRVETAVKLAYYRVLAAQEMLDARRDLTNIARDALETQRRLANTGQADETDVLNAEVDVQRMQIAARMQENSVREEWRSLAAVIGRPELPLATVAGALDQDWPQVNEEEAVNNIARNSPAVQIAETSESRAQMALERARREAIPDVVLRGGAEYSGELLEGIRQPTGWMGFAEVGVQIPLFNRNQGNVAAARAEIDRATQEKSRIGLTLRDRAASVVDQYANARLMAEEYRDGILPSARKAYALMVDKYGRMAAAYPRVLDAQRRLYQLQIEYIAALDSAWSTGIALQGYLLTDGLEGPARPGEVDRPVRETNVPMPGRATTQPMGMANQP
jgi:outer membrane protein, heavy metal efflux system